MDVSGAVHPYELTWKNIDMEGGTSQNPVTINDDSDDNESATSEASNTQSPNKSKGKASAADMDYTAPVFLVRDGCYKQ